MLHVPFTYFPDPCGGTEVYVKDLASALAGHGFNSAVAAPGRVSTRYTFGGIPVFRFAIDHRGSLDLAYGRPDETAAANFIQVLRNTRPDVVHLHARTAAVSLRLVRLAQETGAKVVFTYHTPSASCPNGNMMHEGVRPCDGHIEPRRCVACVLRSRHVSSLVSAVAAAAPARVIAAVASLPMQRKPISSARIPGLIARHGVDFRAFIEAVDHVVAVSDWVHGVLIANGTDADKLSVSRQGIAVSATSPHPARRAVSGQAPLRIAYFGRLAPEKGADILASALQSMPGLPAEAHFYAVRQDGSEAQYDRLIAQSRQDSRLVVRTMLPPDAVVEAMSGYDLVAIPSRWLETGPLVALEAFAAGVPVLGSRLGGLCEIVRDGIDGLLLAPGDVSAWASAIDRLAGDRGIVQKLRTGIAPPRRIDACAADMARVYGRLLAGTIEGQRRTAAPA